MHQKYKNIVGEVIGELFIQFLARIYNEIEDCKIATFSTLKYLNSPKSAKFRTFFKAKSQLGFISIGNTFDNVIGKFPIGFIIWNSEERQEIFKQITFDVFDKKGLFIGEKTIINYDENNFINDWLKAEYDKINNKIGVLGFVANDFQNQKLVFITGKGRGHHETNITIKNLIEFSIYFCVRHVFEHTWLNHNDQFLYPNDNWKKDVKFQNDCICFTLFFEKNQIKSSDGTNHWIPFTEQEVNAKEKFESNFMTQFIAGKLKIEQPTSTTLFGDETKVSLYDGKPKVFSEEAKAVFNAGRELWKYYHSQEFPSHGGVAESRGGYNVNASFYDIRAHFQGRNEKGRMNAKSDDAEYSELIAALRQSLKILADKIKPKIYEFEFLKE